MPEEYRLINMQVSEECKPTDIHGFKISEKTNHVLSLLQSYENLAGRYSPVFRNALDKSIAIGLMSSESITPEQFAAFYERNYVLFIMHYTEDGVFCRGLPMKAENF
jgi:hypothetical protein